MSISNPLRWINALQVITFIMQISTFNFLSLPPPSSTEYKKYLSKLKVDILVEKTLRSYELWSLYWAAEWGELFIPLWWPTFLFSFQDIGMHGRCGPYRTDYVQAEGSATRPW